MYSSRTILVFVHFLFIILLFNLFQCHALEQEQVKLRIALFNIRELSTSKILETDKEGVGQNPQLKAAANIIKRINPDVLILNELDHDYQSMGEGLDANAIRFQDTYLKTGPDGISFQYHFVAPCNTGIPSGLDLNNDGMTATRDDAGSRDYGTDCFGFGTYPGQYAMGVYSKYPIDTLNVRTFQKFLWKDLPGNHIPTNYYSREAIEIFRLSSKSHWDITLNINEHQVHLLLSHPTPPAFDGKEDRNGRRNFDEIKFWIHYLENDPSLYDDKNQKGGILQASPFIIAGDLNASPNSESRYDGIVAIEQLLNHPEIKDTGKWLMSEGACDGKEKGAPDFWERSTAKFGRDFRTRIDYILPCKNIRVADGGAFWPSQEKDPAGHLLAETASDHRLVWLDIILP